tara:strand:+ start:5667 stop:6047 length:381 start_codon:yes stop_codon:yes gene_type:complete
LHGYETAQAGVAALQFLQGKPVGDRADSSAAVTLQVSSEKAELRHLSDQLPRESPLLEAGRKKRKRPLFDKFPYTGPYEQFLIRVELIELIIIRGFEGHGSKPSVTVAGGVVEPAKKSLPPGRERL